MFSGEEVIAKVEKFLFLHQTYFGAPALSLGNRFGKQTFNRPSHDGVRLPDAEVIARICERHRIDYTY